MTVYNFYFPSWVLGMIWTFLVFNPTLLFYDYNVCYMNNWRRQWAHASFRWSWEMWNELNTNVTSAQGRKGFGFPWGCCWYACVGIFGAFPKSSCGSCPWASFSRKALEWSKVSADVVPYNGWLYPAFSLLLDKSRAIPDGTPCGAKWQVGDSSSISWCFCFPP